MPVQIIGEYEQVYRRMLDLIRRGMWSDDPLFSNIELQHVEHAGPIRSGTTDRPFDHPMVASVEGHTVFVYDLWKAEEAIIGPRLFEAMAQISDAADNSIDMRGRAIEDALLEAYEKMDISFNEDGTPNTLQIFVSPETAELFKGIGPETDEFRTRYEAIIARKKEEFYAKKRFRRLSQTTKAGT